jgi:hypothetical protein
VLRGLWAHGIGFSAVRLRIEIVVGHERGLTAVVLQPSARAVILAPADGAERLMSDSLRRRSIALLHGGFCPAASFVVLHWACRVRPGCGDSPLSRGGRSAQSTIG